MRCLLSKCRLASIFFISMSVTIVACGANDEKIDRVSSGLNKQCTALAALNLPHTVITNAEYMSAGDYPFAELNKFNTVGPKGQHALEVREVVRIANYIEGDGVTYTLPAFCRVQAVSVPTADSHIKMELWMPAKGWTGRYHQVAIGGGAGAISYDRLVHRLNVGDSVATTDTGHVSLGGYLWAAGRPERKIDFGYRAHKETSDIAKAIVEQYYGRKHDYAYFSGCSRGGHAGLVSAQRYPEDWEGILVGATAPDLVKHLSYRMWRSLMQHQKPEGRIWSSKLPAIQRKAQAACSSEAHIADGIPADPRFCRYDPEVLLCNGEETDECLMKAQVDLLRNLYDGPIDPETGERLLYRLPPTMEAANVMTKDRMALLEAWYLQGARPEGESLQQGGRTPKLGEATWATNDSLALQDFFRGLVFDDPGWDITGVNLNEVWFLAKDSFVAGEKLERLLRVNINWKGFRETNTKMLMYHGWADDVVQPELGIKLYDEALAQLGDESRTQDFLRLFMVPGMLHCGDGPGANVFGQWGRPGLKNDAQHDIINALETWVEAGVAPETIIATKYVDNNLKNGIEFTRPLCVFPKVPVYKGIGDINEASSFECRKGATPQ